MRTGLITRSIAVVAAAVMLGGSSVTQAEAQSAFSASIAPTSGPAGSSFTISWRTDITSGWPCKQVSFSSALVAIPVQPWQNLKVTATAPASAAPGTYPITVSCGNYGSTLRFTVTRAATTPPTTPPPVTTTPYTPPVTPYTPPPVTTTRPPVTTTPPRTTTTTTTTTPPVTTTTVPPTTTAPPTSTAPPPITTADAPRGDLQLDRASVQPGDELSAQGRGCTPGAPVVLTSGSERVGSTTADPTGRFTAPVEFTTVEPGRHTITAECGIVLTGAVDQIVTSSTGGSSTTLVVLVFFVLAGAALVRFA